MWGALLKGEKNEKKLLFSQRQKCMPVNFSWERATQAKAFAHYSPCQLSLCATPCRFFYPHGKVNRYRG